VADGDLQSVGEALRAAREAQGFSLQEVEAQTRIRLKFLRALEEGDVDVLPSDLHAKGFLRNYALFLRLDADDLVDRFSAATGHTPRPLTRLTETPAPYPPPGTRATPPFAVEGGEMPPAEASDVGVGDVDVPVDDLPPGAEAEAADAEGVMLEADAAAEDVEEVEAETAVEAEAVVEADDEAAPEEEPVEVDLAPPPPPRPAHSTFIPTSQRVGPGVPRGLVGQPAPVPVPPEEMGAPPPEEPPTRERRQRSPAARAMRSNIFAAAALVLAFAAIIWFVTSRLSQISGEALVSATPVPVEALINTPEGEATPGADAEAAGDGENGEPTPFPTAATGAAAGESVEAASVAGRVVLSMDVVQRSWVRVDVDGETAFEGQAQIGEVLLYEGEDTVLIRAGNGAGLEATVNGQAIGPLGERGEVVERMFTPDGEIEPPAGSGGGVGPGDDAELTTTPGGEPTSTPTPPPTPEP
jgi:transcriptional regulator with XRE-family HTH domain